MNWWRQMCICLIYLISLWSPQIWDLFSSFWTLLRVHHGFQGLSLLNNHESLQNAYGSLSLVLCFYMAVYMFPLLNLLDCGMSCWKSSVCVNCGQFHTWHQYNYVFRIAQCFTHLSCLTISEESILTIGPSLLNPLPIVGFSFVLLEGGWYYFFPYLSCSQYDPWFLEILYEITKLTSKYAWVLFFLSPNNLGE